MSTINFTLRMPMYLGAKLKKLADERGISMNAMITEWMENELNNSSAKVDKEV